MLSSTIRLEVSWPMLPRRPFRLFMSVVSVGNDEDVGTVFLMLSEESLSFTGYSLQ